MLGPTLIHVFLSDLRSEERDKAGHKHHRKRNDKVLKIITMPLAQKNSEPQN